MTFWTDERKAQVAEMLGAGLTFQDIGNHFHTSRNAIAGVINRNNPLRLMTRRPQGNRPTPTVAKPAGRPRKIAVKKAPLPPVEDKPRPPVMRRVGLLELSRTDCRFPVEDDPDVIGGLRFCGAPTIDTYCAFHAAVAFAGKGKGYDG
jgi:hypothetical protein